jgi:hypothetical protein
MNISKKTVTGSIITDLIRNFFEFKETGLRREINKLWVSVFIAAQTCSAITNV